MMFELLSGSRESKWLGFGFEGFFEVGFNSGFGSFEWFDEDWWVLSCESEQIEVFSIVC